MGQVSFAWNTYCRPFFSLEYFCKQGKRKHVKYIMCHISYHWATLFRSWEARNLVIKSCYRVSQNGGRKYQLTRNAANDSFIQQQWRGWTTTDIQQNNLPLCLRSFAWSSRPNYSTIGETLCNAILCVGGNCFSPAIISSQSFLHISSVFQLVLFSSCFFAQNSSSLSHYYLILKQWRQN